MYRNERNETDRLAWWLDARKDSTILVGSRARGRMQELPTRRLVTSSAVICPFGVRADSLRLHRYFALRPRAMQHNWIVGLAFQVSCQSRD
jgi:hypothetical protein